MKFEDKLKLLNDLESYYCDVDSRFLIIECQLGVNHSGGLQESVYKLFDVAVKSLAEAMSVREDDLFWHIYDNDWGRCGLSLLNSKGAFVRITSNCAFLDIELADS